MAGQHPVESALVAAWPAVAWRNRTIILAVSGGADSVALLRACAAWQKFVPARWIVAHVNHELRGAAARADEAFVVETCLEWRLPCAIFRLGETFAARRRSASLESAARKARYACLTRLAAQLSAAFVVTAHTADDQAETILHHILRGTGLAGLAGMPVRRQLGPTCLMRPWLHVRRDALRTYLKDLGQTFREDESNTDHQFTRNRLRHDLLPRLATDYNPQVVEALARLGSLARDALDDAERRFASWMTRCVLLAEPQQLVIDCRSLFLESRSFVQDFLKYLWTEQSWPRQRMSQARWQRLADLVSLPEESKSARIQSFPDGIEARRDGAQLTLECKPRHVDV